MKPTYQIINDDCLVALKDLPDNSIDAVISDPPYGLSFMGKTWDIQVPSVAIWQQVLRVLKPGAHGLIACGTRTQHRMATNLELAGFEIRDVICHHYATGFPKSHNVSVAIDNLLGKEPTTIAQAKGRTGTKAQPNGSSFSDDSYQWPGTFNITTPTSPEAQMFEGYGTALKPSVEFWTLIRKPLDQPTVAQNVLTHHTGALNIDATRIATNDDISIHQGNLFAGNSGIDTKENFKTAGQAKGRFPANTILSHHPDCTLLGTKLVGVGEPKQHNNTVHNTHAGYHRPNRSMFTHKKDGVAAHGKTTELDYDCHPDCPVHILDQQSGTSPSNFRDTKKGTNSNGVTGWQGNNVSVDDQGTASRFFFTPKPSSCERSLGLPETNPNNHPTLKSIELMRYLIKLVTPPTTPTSIPTGLKPPTVLDPFAGSGTTGCACAIESVSFIGMELDEHFADIAAQRITYYKKHRLTYNQTDATGKVLKTTEAHTKAQATPDFLAAPKWVPHRS